MRSKIASDFDSHTTGVNLGGFSTQDFLVCVHGEEQPLQRHSKINSPLKDNVGTDSLIGPPYANRTDNLQSQVQNHIHIFQFRPKQVLSVL